MGTRHRLKQQVATVRQIRETGNMTALCFHGHQDAESRTNTQVQVKSVDSDHVTRF